MIAHPSCRSGPGETDAGVMKKRRERKRESDFEAAFLFADWRSAEV
jgi:hypothetical protein